MRAFLPCVLSTFLVPLAAQEKPAPGAPPAPAATAPARPANPIHIGKDGFVLPAGEFTLEELIEAAAEYLQCNILWNPAELAPATGAPLAFVFQKQLALDAPGCEDVLGQLLYTKGFALLTLDPDKGIYEVVSVFGPRGHEIVDAAQRRPPDEILRRPRLKQYVVTEVRLEHINATAATNALRPFFAQRSGPNQPGSTFGTAGSSSTVLIAGFQDQVAQIIQMLRSCDVPGADATPDVALRVARLEQLVQQLQKQPVGAKPAGK